MKSHHNKRLTSGLALLVLAACSISGPLRDDPKATGVSYTAPSSSRWEALKEKSDADAAWVHKKTGATLAMRSVCRRYEHISLPALSQNLINTLQDAEIVSQEPTTLAGRSALITTFHGHVDGVAIQNRLVVMRKDECIFDFNLSELKTLSSDVLTDFDEFLKSFAYTGGVSK